MPETWIDQEAVKSALASFFAENRKNVTLFGNTVNQTFEAFVFSSVVSWYRERGWDVRFRHPARRTDESLPGRVRLKFSTRGRPRNYSYVECNRNGVTVHIRHQLRVATRFHDGQYPPANVCLDVGVVKETDVSGMNSNDHLENDRLITFGEAKHMSAFAELVANFEGLVHEMQPQRLDRLRAGKGGSTNSKHPSPFLYVSGILYHTAEGIVKTIEKRGYDIDVFDRTNALTESMRLVTKPAPARTRARVDRVRRSGDVEEVPF